MKRLNSRNQEILFKIFLNLRSKQSNEGGYIIVIVAGLIVAMSTMLLTGELVSRVDNNSTKSSSNSTAGFYAAEAGLNLRAKEIKAKFVGYELPKGTSPVSSTDCSGGGGDFACNDNLKVQDYLYPNDSSKRIQVRTYVVDQNVPYVNNLPNPKSSTLSSGTYEGLNAQEFIYDVTSVAFDRITGQPTASLGIRFKSQLIPIFQFAAFYGGVQTTTKPAQDLDYSIPPDMTMNGPIHSNGSIYLNAASSSTLQINGNLTMSKNLYRGQRLTSSCSGTVKIYTSSLACSGSGTSQYSQATLDQTWTSKQIRTNLKDLASPPVSTFNSDSTGFYWNSAQLRVVLNLDSNNNPVGIQVQTPSGGVDTSATNNLLGATCAPTSTTLKTAASLGTTALSVNPNSWSGVTPLQIEPAGTTNYNSNLEIDNDANVVNAPTSGTLTLSKQLGTAPLAGAVVRKATVWTSNTFWNYREKNVPGTPASNDAKQIRMLNVDVKALMTCANQIMGGKNINDTTNGGLVWYFTVKGPTATTNSSTYGIRLYNGAILASNNSGDPVVKGLSVVSDQPIYVLGDYNCEWDERIKSGTTPYGCSTNPAYVSSPPPLPTGTMAPFKNPNAIYNKKPAAIMADSINVLSNSWPLDDAYSVAYSGGGQPTTIPTGATYALPQTPVLWSNRKASDTTVNAAFLAGIDPSGGGLNNYPRFLEDWTSRTLTYRGSMVSLGEPQRVSGPFCGSAGAAGCNIYAAPFRNWDYDTDFNNAGLLPPLTPRVVNLQQERFTRDYTRTSFMPLSLPFSSLFSTLEPFTRGSFHF
jgi:hypothetical protein